MIWQQTPYTFPLFLSALVSAALASYIWQRRNRDGATALSALIELGTGSTFILELPLRAELCNKE